MLVIDYQMLGSGGVVFSSPWSQKLTGTVTIQIIFLLMLVHKDETNHPGMSLRKPESPMAAV